MFYVFVHVFVWVRAQRKKSAVMFSQSSPNSPAFTHCLHEGQVLHVIEPGLSGSYDVIYLPLELLLYLRVVRHYGNERVCSIRCGVGTCEEKQCWCVCVCVRVLGKTCTNHLLTQLKKWLTLLHWDTKTEPMYGNPTCPEYLHALVVDVSVGHHVWPMLLLYPLLRRQQGVVDALRAPFLVVLLKRKKFQLDGRSYNGGPTDKFRVGWGPGKVDSIRQGG